MSHEPWPLTHTTSQTLDGYSDKPVTVSRGPRKKTLGMDQYGALGLRGSGVREQYSYGPSSPSALCPHGHQSDIQLQTVTDISSVYHLAPTARESRKQSSRCFSLILSMPTAL